MVLCVCTLSDTQMSVILTIVIEFIPKCLSYYAVHNNNIVDIYLNTQILSVIIPTLIGVHTDMYLNTQMSVILLFLMELIIIEICSPPVT